MTCPTGCERSTRLTTAKYHKCPQAAELTHIIYDPKFKTWNLECVYDGNYIYDIQFCPYCGTQLDWDNPHTFSLGDD